MPKSLAQIRESTTTGLPRRSYELCLAVFLLGEMQSLTAELADLISRPNTDEDGKVRRVNAPEPPRVVEIKARMADLDSELREHTGVLMLQGIDPGEWDRWVDQHPARTEGEAGYDRDLWTTFGICNADDLKADLGRYVDTWSGDPLADGDWDTIRSKAAGGDLKELAKLVVKMHETAVDLPKLRELWRVGMTSDNG